MGETVHESDDSLPLNCEVCGESDEADGYTLEVVDDDEELREDDWYFHLADAGDVDEDTGVIREPVLYAFCPECAPETPPDIDAAEFDIDAFVETLSED